MKHKIYLVPGFFGFANLGGISYFRRVNETLADVFERRGLEVEIIGVKTLPTASLRHRARRLVMTVRETGGLEPGVKVHFIGHSTGALDARLAACPNAKLDMGDSAEGLAENLQTIVSIAGPHFGTPLANFFTTIYGKNLLYMVTLLVIVGLRRRPITLLGGLIGVLGKINDLLGLDETLITQITNDLLKDFNPSAEAEVRQFLRSILDDQGCMVQITPEGMDVFNATTFDNPAVRYVSYATAAPPPIEVFKKISVRHALTPLNKVLYSVLWTLTSRAHAHYPYHPPIRSEDAITKRPLPFAITESTSDGVVPTLSQIWGEFRGVVRADHLDIIGHYLRGPFDERDGADWFGSGAKFDRETFQWLWEDVANVLMREDRR
jgi:triacylglycerol esterase/lipase EstA (alpha/beta hydrolase family)